MPDEQIRVDFDGDVLLEEQHFEFGSSIDSAQNVLDADLEIRIFSEDGSSLQEKLIQYLGPVEARMSIGPLPPKEPVLPPEFGDITAKDEELVIDFTPGSNLSGLYVLRYKLSSEPVDKFRLLTHVGKAKVTIPSDTIERPPYTLLGLRSATAYDLRLSRGKDTVYSETTATTLSIPLTPPLVSVTEENNTTVHLRVEGGTPQGDGNWYYEYRVFRATTWIGVQTTTSTSPDTLIVSGLSPGTRYEMRVRRGGSPAEFSTIVYPTTTNE